MDRKQWTDQDKATALAALDANNGNVNRTAKQLHIAESTLRSWTNGRGTNSDVAVLHEVKKGELADRLEEIAHRILNTLPDKLKDANVQQLATALGIVLDKKQLLEGKPTERTETIDTTLDNDERLKRINSLLERARARRDGHALEDNGR